MLETDPEKKAEVEETSETSKINSTETSTKKNPHKTNKVLLLSKDKLPKELPRLNQKLKKPLN